MPMNVSPPVSSAVPSAAKAGPAASALAVATASPSGTGSQGGVAAQGSTPAAQQADSGDAAATGAQQAAASTGNAQTASGAAGQQQSDAFARLLEAQMGAVAAGQGTPTQPGIDDGKAPATAKPAKGPAQGQAAATDPNLLPNPALLALQQQPVATQPVAMPISAPTPDPAALDAAAKAATAHAPAVNTAADLQALRQAADSTGATAAAATGNEKASAAMAAFAMSHPGDDDALQKLPHEQSSQPTILPQQAMQQASVDAQKTQPSTVPTFNIPQQVGTPDWSKSVSDQVMAMVNIKAETAHIQLNPPQLGPIEVTLKMDAHNNAQVTFTADSPATRAALQDSLPRLHSMMAAGGIQLGDAQVSSGQSQQRQQSFLNSSRSGMRDEPPEGEEVDTLASIKAARGVLSIFA